MDGAMHEESSSDSRFIIVWKMLINGGYSSIISNERAAMSASDRGVNGTIGISELLLRRFNSAYAALH